MNLVILCRSLQALPRLFVAMLSALALLLSASAANAQIYKCSSGDKTVYSDTPCASGSTQTLTDIQSGTAGVAATPSADLALERRLDMAVKTAIGNGDFIRAQALAVTQQQRDWITVAKKEYDKNALANRTEDYTSAEKSDSAECLQARRNLEQAASSFTQPEVLSARTSLMHEACGMSDAPDYVYGGGAAPLLVYPYRYGRHHHGAVPYTSPPYDRTMATPFGSRFIRPEEYLRPVRPPSPN